MPTDHSTSTSLTEREIATQPDCWVQAQRLAASVDLRREGARMAVIGCGSSWFTAMCVAALREAYGHGETDAFTPSEAPLNRAYDVVVAISRSGTTTEVVRALEDVAGRIPTVAVVAVADAPVAAAADEVVLLDFADEESVVQTRFVTTAIALARAAVGDPGLPVAIDDARRVLARAPQLDGAAPDRFVLLGTGWALGLAHEAALKLRETAQAWSEAYPAMEYRHGPIAVADAGTAAWTLGDPPEGLVDELRAVGATVVVPDVDPLAALVDLQRIAVARALARGLDPDHPRHLTRSIVLDHQ
jgi:fructoselysine-6-P-deglycase FrlB-like protein